MLKKDKGPAQKISRALPPVDLDDAFLNGVQAAALLSTTTRTLIRWEQSDPPLLVSYRLPTGARRYRRSDVLKLLSITRWEPKPHLQARAAMMRERRAKSRLPKPTNTR